MQECTEKHVTVLLVVDSLRDCGAVNACLKLKFDVLVQGTSVHTFRNSCFSFSSSCLWLYCLMLQVDNLVFENATGIRQRGVHFPP